MMLTTKKNTLTSHLGAEIIPNGKLLKFGFAAVHHFSSLFRATPGAQIVEVPQRHGNLLTSNLEITVMAIYQL